jgi:CRP-like cAMP-binding protein
MIVENGLLPEREPRMASIDQGAVHNRLLRALRSEAFEMLQPTLEWVDLPLRSFQVEADQKTSHVYFLESGLGSVVARTGDDEAIEIGHVGFEGLSGAHCILRLDTTPNQTFMQVRGEGIRTTVAALHRLMDEHSPSRDLFLHYVHCCELQLAHSALANGRYNVGERLARWLLMCHDRLRVDDMPLTHEFLALMLGVRRSGVTDHLHILEGALAIKATRGAIHIRDRAKLLEMAGGCYGTPEREYNRLIGAL